MIKMEHISFSYGEKDILKEFSMTLQKGERICLFGPSGCGKTTVLRIVMGLETSFAGQFENGFQRIAPVFQTDRLIPSYTVAQNIRFGCGKDGLEIAEALELTELLDRRPDAVSGGQRRRAALARALNFGGDLLILDEPFNGQDERSIGLCVEAIHRFANDAAVLMVSHDPEHAQKMDAELLYMTKQH